MRLADKPASEARTKGGRVDCKSTESKRNQIPPVSKPTYIALSRSKKHALMLERKLLIRQTRSLEIALLRRVPFIRDSQQRSAEECWTYGIQLECSKRVYNLLAHWHLAVRARAPAEGGVPGWRSEGRGTGETER